MKYTLTILEEHRKELESLVLKDDGFERPALLLCGRSSISNDVWDGGAELRFLSKKVIPIPESEIISKDETHVKWNTDAKSGVIDHLYPEQIDHYELMSKKCCPI